MATESIKNTIKDESSLTDSLTSPYVKKEIFPLPDEIKVENFKSEIEHLPAPKNNSKVSLESIKSNKNENHDKARTSDANSNTFLVNDIIWAKQKGFPFWPARIIKEPITTYEESETKYSKKKKKIMTVNEYFVNFFGYENKKIGYVSKDHVRPYDSEKTKTEALKKCSSSMLKEMHVAIENADKESKRLVIVDSNSVKINGIVSSSVNNKHLPSMDEELNIIKGQNSRKENRSESMDIKPNESTNMNKRKSRNSIACESVVLKNKNNIVKTVTLLQKSKISKFDGEALKKNFEDSVKLLKQMPNRSRSKTISNPQHFEANLKESPLIKKRRRSIANMVKVNSDESDTEMLSASFKNSRVSLESIKSNKNEISDKSRTSDINTDVFLVNSIVWAKQKGFTFWPARIIKEPIAIYEESETKNSKAKKKSSKIYDYFVNFFGYENKTNGYVSKDNIHPYDSEKTRLDALNKNKNKPRTLKELHIAIENADKESKRLVIVDSNSVKINGIVSSSVNNKHLPSMDEELIIIKGQNSRKENRSESMDIKPNESTSMNKRKSRNSIACESVVLKNKNNIVKTVTLLQKSKISKFDGEALKKNFEDSVKLIGLLQKKKEELDNKFKKRPQKRSRSVDSKISGEPNQAKKRNTTKSQSKSKNTSYQENIKKRRRLTNVEQENTSVFYLKSSELFSSPDLPFDTDMELAEKSDLSSACYQTFNAENELVEEFKNIENFSFDSVTFVVDSSREYKPYPLHLLTWYLMAQLNKYFALQTDGINKNENFNTQLISISIFDISQTSKKAQITKNYTNEKNQSESDEDKSEYEVISYAKSPITNSSITIKKKKRSNKEVLEDFLNSKVSNFNKIKLNYIDDIGSAFKSKLVLSLVASEKNDEFEWQKNSRFFENSITEDKIMNGQVYISLVPVINSINKYFNCNDCNFIEAPMIFQNICDNPNIDEEEFKESISIYIAARNENLFRSMRNFFDILANKKNINYYDNNFGMPSRFVQIYTSMSENNILKRIMDSTLAIKPESNQDHNEKLKIENKFLKQMFKKKIIESIDSLIDQTLSTEDKSENEKPSSD